MSAKIKAIARIVFHDSGFNNFDTMSADEIAEEEAKTEGMLQGDDYGGLGRYVPIACAASKAWDAAIEFARRERSEA